MTELKRIDGPRPTGDCVPVDCFRMMPDARRRLRVVARSLARDSVTWARNLSKRLRTSDERLKRDLAAEAAGFATWLLVNHFGTELDQESVVAEICQAWQQACPGDWTERTKSDLLEWRSAQGGPCSVIDSDEQLAKEFQSLTGLSDEAWVGGGFNLAALVFYQRIFLRIRDTPQLTRAHRAQILVAARQCKDRFRNLLAREAELWGANGRSEGKKPAGLAPLATGHRRLNPQ